MDTSKTPCVKRELRTQKQALKQCKVFEAVPIGLTVYILL